jgi:hypothetical protein
VAFQDEACLVAMSRPVQVTHGQGELLESRRIWRPSGA